MTFQYAAVIPCFNVGKACIPVLTQTAPQVSCCVAVDDGSTDNTYESMAGTGLQQLHILRHPQNQGKGAALINGFRYLLERDFDAILTLDGDGQHDPSLIPLFLAEFERTRADLIYGNRMTNKRGMPLHRQWLNGISNWTISTICGQRIEDSQCGFRLHSRHLLASVLDKLKTGRYELETEILILASRMKFKISMIPVSTIYSVESSGLSHHSFTDVLRIGRLLTSQLLLKR